jgi:hypothetical protein
VGACSSSRSCARASNHLLAITAQELCVTTLALVLGMSVSALSHQLRAA